MAIQYNQKVLQATSIGLPNTPIANVQPAQDGMDTMNMPSPTNIKRELAFATPACRNDWATQSRKSPVVATFTNNIATNECAITNLAGLN